MTILVSAANGKTGRNVISALLARGDAPSIRALLRRPASTAIAGVTAVYADLSEPKTLGPALHEVDTVIHYGPSLHPHETTMGMNMIDAAKSAGVRRFIFISVIHPEIENLLNHKAKLAIEAYLINSRMDWTVLRPQHYMQNINVERVVAQGKLAMPYPVETVLGHVDMRDLAEAAAKVATEPGHAYATYDVDAAEHLSVTDIAATVSRLSGKPVQAIALDPYDFVNNVGPHWGEPLSDYAIEAFHRLFGYYARFGIYGNANVLTWLLGRRPRSFEDYVRNALEGTSGPASTVY
jgi:uncharacterized protein YbjT (DUF2867 family)